MESTSDTAVNAHTGIGENSDILPPNDPAAYDAWFQAKVQEALDDPHPGYSNQEVLAHFARRRAETLHQIEQNGK